MPKDSDSHDETYDSLKSKVYERMRASRFEDKIFTVMLETYTRALSAEEVVLSRKEHNVLLRDILKDALQSMLQKL
jgi:hypothetical protein